MIKRVITEDNGMVKPHNHNQTRGYHSDRPSARPPVLVSSPDTNHLGV